MNTITDQNFEGEVLKSDLPVLVDFWAVWCGPCQMALPVIDQLAKDYEGKVKIGKANVDENPKIANQFQIMSIPTVVLFQNGKEIKRLIGFPGKEGYQKFLDESLSKENH